MRIVPQQQVEPAAWDDACRRSGDSWLFHSSDWIAIEETYREAENLSFAIERGGAIVAVQPLYRRMLGLGTWTEQLLDSGVHRHTGFAVVDGENREALRREAMQRVFTIAQEHDVDRIQLDVQNLAPRARGPEREEIPFWARDHRFELGLAFGPLGMDPAPGAVTRCHDQIVDLSRPADAIFGAFDPSCRRALRKAGRSELELEVEQGTAWFDRWLKLAERSAMRTGEPVLPRGYFAAIAAAFGESGRCAALFVVHEGRDAAGVLLLADRGAVHFLAGASDPSLLSLRVNDFAHWQAIRWAMERGHTLYRLGPTFPDLPPEWPIVRQARFKSKFGGMSRPVIQGSFFRHPERYVSNVSAA